MTTKWPVATHRPNNLGLQIAIPDKMRGWVGWGKFRELAQEFVENGLNLVEEVAK